MAKGMNMQKQNLKLLFEKEREEFSFHGAITNYDHWLTEAEADEKIYIFHSQSKDTQQKYLIEEQKFLDFFKILGNLLECTLCFDIENFTKVYIYKESPAAFLEEIKKGLREEKAQRITITDLNHSFRILICYDLIAILDTNFPIEESSIEYAIKTSGLFIL